MGKLKGLRLKQLKTEEFKDLLDYTFKKTKELEITPEKQKEIEEINEMEKAMGLENFLNLYDAEKPKLDELKLKVESCNLALAKVCSVNFNPDDHPDPEEIKEESNELTPGQINMGRRKSI